MGNGRVAGITMALTPIQFNQPQRPPSISVTFSRPKDNDILPTLSVAIGSPNLAKETPAKVVFGSVAFLPPQSGLTSQDTIADGPILNAVG